MNVLKKIGGAGAATLLAIVLTLPAAAQRYDDARGLIQRTQDDLSRLRDAGPRNEKERERIENARKHLSDLDRNLEKNHFDKDRLSEAIEDVQNVLDHNTLEARDRDALRADVTDLRAFRKDK